MLALVDADAFFCNCERLRHPQAPLRPTIVLSRNDGIIVSADWMAKDLGLKVGLPYFQIKDICLQHQVMVCSSHFELYQDISTRLMELLAEEAEIEVYSVDEAYLHLPSRMPWTAPRLLAYGEKIISHVAQQIGIPVSVGLAPTKVLAKVASYTAKHPSLQNKVFGKENFLRQDNQIISGHSGRSVFITPHLLARISSANAPHPLLQNFKVENLWGIGPATAVELRLLGIATAEQLRCYPYSASLSRAARQIQLELQGHPVFIAEAPAKQKSFLHSRSFSPPLTDRTSILDKLRDFVGQTATQLREQNSTCQKIKVFCGLGRPGLAGFTPFLERKTYSAEFKFMDPTSDTRKLIKAAENLLTELTKQTTIVYRLGIELSMIYSDEVQRQNFLEENDTPASQNLMQVVDQINQQEGPGAINFGRAAPAKENPPPSFLAKSK